MNLKKKKKKIKRKLFESLMKGLGGSKKNNFIKEHFLL